MINMKDFKKKICILNFPSNDLFYYNSQALPKDQLNEFSYKMLRLRYSGYFRTFFTLKRQL